ncbi:MAG: site-specific integrase, partial [Chloroflexota bacterium]|nr:site-specific integrase [Chloroflexota bacterium]
MNFDEQLEKFYYYLSSEKRYSNNTLESYSNDLKLLTNYLESKKKKNWESITESDITQYFKEINKNLSRNTAKRKYASMKSFFKFMFQEGHILENILTDIKSPKSSSTIPKPLSIKEMDMILMKSNTSKKFSRDTTIFTT